MMLRRAVAAVVFGSALFPCALANADVPGKWDHKANVKDAAQRLVKLHRREGSTGVLKFLDACYRTHLLASEFNQGLEGCMAQDYMHTQVLALIYSKVPPENLKKMGAPSPQVIAKSMNDRFVTSFAQYKVSVAAAEDFKKLVDTQGFPIFVKGIFPKSNQKPGNVQVPGDAGAGR